MTMILSAFMRCWPLLPLLGLWWAASRFGNGTAMMGWLAIWACLCGGAALLLGSTGVGECSWKNQVAGFALRWGHGLTQGKLWRMTLISWVVWSMLGLAVVTGMNRLGSGASEVASVNSDRPIWSVILLLGWILDGAALLYLLGVLAKNFEARSKSGMQLIALMAFITLLIAASVVLKGYGLIRLAAIVAGVPALVAAVCFAPVIVMIIAATFSGRKHRWN